MQIASPCASPFASPPSSSALALNSPLLLPSAWPTRRLSEPTSVAGIQTHSQRLQEQRSSCSAWQEVQAMAAAAGAFPRANPQSRDSPQEQEHSSHDPTLEWVQSVRTENESLFRNRIRGRDPVCT